MDTYEIANVIGRKAIAEAVGVQATAVSNAIVRGKFPPAWFIAVQGLAQAAGIDCPPCIFGMIVPQSSVSEQRPSSGVK